MTRLWTHVRAQMTEHLSHEQRGRWDKALKLAKIRYASEIRKYRKIDRLRKMYRRRKR